MDMKLYSQNIEYIIEHVSEHRLYEQLAEECCELAQAALKMSRYLQKEDSVAMTEEEIYSKLDEEMTDVHVCMDTLYRRLTIDTELAAKKVARWKSRIDEIMNTDPEEAISHE